MTITRATAQTNSAVIRDETIALANTATRVGTYCRDLADSVLWPGEASIVNADINAAAAIAGTKISPDFGAQNVVTTGYVGGGGSLFPTAGGLRISSTTPSLYTRTGGGGNLRIFELVSGVPTYGDTGTSLRIEGSSMTIRGATLERINITDTGIGFFATAAVAKQTITGSRATGAAFTDLLAKLAVIGLVTDSSSA